MVFVLRSVKIGQICGVERCQMGKCSTTTGRDFTKQMERHVK